MPADPSRVRDVFLAAVDLPAGERAAFLAEACGDDAALRAEVERLLAADGAPDSILESVPPPTDAATGVYVPERPAAADLPEAASSTVDTGADRPDRTWTLGLADPDSTVAHATPPPAPAPPTGDGLGTVIAGRYTLIKMIGEGGMGSVYLAEQSEPVKRRVALKLIRTGMDSRGVLARFEAERQALALMDHPNIARIYDGGVTPAGQPFFVMELVDGVPLTDYCDRRRMTVRDRLALFASVCQAVQHAHQKGIIHRDLKPGNVLVAEVDGRPTPKVIDFGVAKATEQKLTDMSFGDTGAIVGTPAYMSPEQADPSSMDIDTRTDVYALGVILYELLTGSPPIDAAQFRRGALFEMLRMVREVDPPRPSTKLSTAEALPSIAANRDVEPARLSKLLRGELDWVVMKALEKDRNRRYDTANGLARDVQRYLADEVVEARPPSRGYRLKKFVKRNKIQVTAASLVALALVGGIVGTSLGMAAARSAERIADDRRVEAERQTKRAENGEKLAGERLVQVEAEKKNAVEQARRAETISRFLQDRLLRQTDASAQAVGLLSLGRPVSEVKANPTVRELLDRAAVLLEPDNLEGGLPDMPQVQAELLATVGRSYLALGEFTRAIDILERARAINAKHLGAEHPQTVDVMGTLGVAYSESGNYEKGLPLLEEAVRIEKAARGPEKANELRREVDLAVEYKHVGKFDQATAIMKERLERDRAALGPEDPKTLRDADVLAGVYLAAEKVDLAVPLFEEALRLKKAKLGPEHPDTITTMGNMALAYKAAGKPALALPLYEEALRLSKAQSGPDQPGTLTIMSNLSDMYLDAKKPDLAITLSEEAVKLTKARFGPEHGATQNAMQRLAQAYLVAGKPALALPIAEEGLKLAKSSLAPGRVEMITPMSTLAAAYLKLGKPDQALPLVEEGVKLVRANLGLESSETVKAVRELSSLYQRVGKVDQAIPLCEEALELAPKFRYGLSKEFTFETEELLCQLYLAAGRLAKIPPILEPSITLRKATFGPAALRTRQAQTLLLQAYMALGNKAPALPLTEELLPNTKAEHGPGHPATISLMNALAVLYMQTGKPDRALPLLEEVLQTQKAAFGPENPGTRAIMGNLAGAYVQAGKPESAVTTIQELVDGCRKAYPEDRLKLAYELGLPNVRLIQAGAFAEAETLARERLRIFSRIQPDDWITPYTRAMLGEALLGQKKYDDAEPSLRSGYEGMKQREARIPPQDKYRIADAAKQLVKLYEETNRPDEAAALRKELDAVGPADAAKP